MIHGDDMLRDHEAQVKNILLFVGERKGILNVDDDDFIIERR